MPFTLEQALADMERTTESRRVPVGSYAKVYGASRKIILRKCGDDDNNEVAHFIICWDEANTSQTGREYARHYYDTVIYPVNGEDILRAQESAFKHMVKLTKDFGIGEVKT